MTTAYENCVVKHLKLAIRQSDRLKQEESYVNEEKLYDFVDTTLYLVLDPSLGIPGCTKGPEVIAALKGMTSVMLLNTLLKLDKAAAMV